MHPAKLSHRLPGRQDSSRRDIGHSSLNRNEGLLSLSFSNSQRAMISSTVGTVSPESWSSMKLLKAFRSFARSVAMIASLWVLLQNTIAKWRESEEFTQHPIGHEYALAAETQTIPVVFEVSLARKRSIAGPARLSIAKPVRRRKSSRSRPSLVRRSIRTAVSRRASG